MQWLMRDLENAGISITRSWSCTPALTIFSTVTITATFESMPIATGQTPLTAAISKQRLVEPCMLE